MLEGMATEFDSKPETEKERDTTKERQQCGGVDKGE